MLNRIHYLFDVTMYILDGSVQTLSPVKCYKNHGTIHSINSSPQRRHLTKKNDISISSFIRQFKANDTIFYFSLLVEQSSLVVLAAHWSCGIVYIPPITLVAEGDSSARDAGARRLPALPDVPRVADVHPGKTDPLLPLCSAGSGPGGDWGNILASGWGTMLLGLAPWKEAQ
jgi:hypothetical protein